MKRLLFLLLLCLCLPGCASREGHPAASTVAAEPETVITAPPSLYDPDSPVEAETAGALKAFPLPHLTPTGLFTLGNDLILTGYADGGTLIQSLTGKSLTVVNSLFLPQALDPREGFFQMLPGRFVCYDPMTLELLVLDSGLRELERIFVPEDISGIPLLSNDGTIFHCTRDAVRALEPGTGIRRPIKEISALYQSVTALPAEGVLQCTLWEEDDSVRTILLSADNGRILYETEGTLKLIQKADRFYAHISTPEEEKLVFGNVQQTPRMLDPACAGAFFEFLPESHGAVAAHTEGDTLILEYYTLKQDSGVLSLTLSGHSLPIAAADAGNGKVWLLTQTPEHPVLYLWDTTKAATTSERVFATAYSTQANPDDAGLEACRMAAEEAGLLCGAEIRIHTDALLSCPAGFSPEPEFLSGLLLDRIHSLRKQFSSLPPEIPQTLSGQYAGLRVGLVRSIASAGSSPAFVSFWDETTACMLLTDGEDFSFYQALFTLMDTVIHTRSDAFDRWEDHNPMQFSYVGTEAVPQSYTTYLDPDTRAFADSASMTGPREERARLFAHAMAPGNEVLFSSLTMQKKLAALCEGIREGFGLKKHPELFPWEQYLQNKA